MYISKTYILIILSLTFFSVRAGSNYTTTPIPTTQTMIGIDSYGLDFSIGVGESGQIVHFNEGMTSLVPSGISEDLFSVHIVDSNFAVSSGKDFALLWNGSNWSTIVDDSNNTSSFITPIWSPPEKNIVYYQFLNTSGGFGFNFICPFNVSDPGNSGFCKAHSTPVLEFCGFAGDVKALQTDGSILRFTQGTLSNLDDPLDGPVFQQPLNQALSLIAAYIPENACLPGNLAPTEIYAVHQPFGGGTNVFYHFDGVSWTNMGSAGTNQTLTGMDGVNSSKVFAFGREPDVVGNKGVAWLWNGTDWQQEVLPENTAGLADVTLMTPLADVIHLNGFEVAQTVLINQTENRGVGALGFFLRALGECAGLKSCASLSQNFPKEFPSADLKVDKTLVDPLPPLSDGNSVAVNDIITYAIKVTNLGADTVSSAILNDIYFSSQLEYVPSSLDCQPSLTDQGSKMNLSFGLVNLGPGDFVICRPKFKVLSIPTQENGAVGVLNVAEVYGNIIDPDLSNNFDVCLIDSNLENQPANRVQCEPELIWLLVGP